ncbi:MAG: PD-(D/E)XK nuclease family protein, partial [Gemmatimonadota bacterium]
MPHEIHLFPPDAAPADLLLQRLRRALAEVEDVLYLTPGDHIARERVLELARHRAVLDPPVMSMGQHARKVLAAADRVLAPSPPPRLVELLLEDALREEVPELVSGPGLAVAARQSIERLMRDGWTHASYRRALDERGIESAAARRLSRLWDRLHELAPDWDGGAVYRAALEKGALEAPRLLLVELGALAGDLEARYLARLMEATHTAGGEVVVGAIATGPQEGPRARSLRAVRSMLPSEVEVREHGVVGADGNGGGSGERGSAAPAGAFARHLFTGTAHPAGQDLPVILLEGARSTDAADLAAMEVRRLLAEAPDADALLDRGITVVVPDREERRRVKRAMERAGLPVVGVPRLPMHEQPGGRYVLLLTELLEQGEDTPISAVLDLLASGGWRQGARTVDYLLRRVQVDGALTLGDVFTLDRLESSESGRRMLGTLRKLLDLAARMKSTASGERAGVLRAALGQADDTSLDPRRRAWRDHGASAAASGHGTPAPVLGAAGFVRPLRKLDDLLELLSERIRRGAWNPTAGEWLEALRRLVRETSLQVGSAPQRGVVIAAPDRVEPSAVVIVSGLTERRFPRTPRQDPFLQDGVLRRLAGGWLPPATSAAGADEEREAFQLACGAAEDRLFLATALMDDGGGELVPSFFIRDAAQALGYEDEDALPRRTRHLRDLAPRSTNGSAEATPDWRARVTGSEEKEWLRLKAGRVSASQLSRYASCPFQHFLESRLRPDAIEVPELDALRKGSLAHGWLYRFGRELDGWRRGEEALEELRATPAPTAPRSAFAPLPARLDYQATLEETVAFLEGELERLEAAAFAPRYHELAFGRGQQERDPASLDDPVALEVEGREIRFAGSIDRVDVAARDGGGSLALAIDYKTGHVKDYTRALERGEEIQLPLYLRILETGFGQEPVGALYMSVRHDEVAGVVREEHVGALGGLGGNVLVLGEEDWKELRARADAEIARLQASMADGKIAAAPRRWDCGFCEAQAICRIDVWR